LVDSVESMMLHGLANTKFKNVHLFINDWIQLRCHRHVSNNQVFHLRQTCTCIFMVF